MKWTSTESEKPEPQRLLIVSTDKGLGVATYNPIYKSFDVLRVEGNTQYGNYVISHWMYLPGKPSN